MDKSALKKACNEVVRPSEYLDYREFLDALYHALKESNPEYTYFDFAEDAGLGHNNLMNALIRGRRPLTLKTGKRIVAGLGLVGRERQYFEALVEHAYERDPLVRLRGRLDCANRLIALAGSNQCLRECHASLHEVGLILDEALEQVDGLRERTGGEVEPAERRLQALREAAGLLGARAFRPVHVQRPAHDEAIHRAVLKATGERRKVVPVSLAVDNPFGRLDD